MPAEIILKQDETATEVCMCVYVYEKQTNSYKSISAKVIQYFVV